MTSPSAERTPETRDDVERARPSRWTGVVIPSLLGCATVVLLLGVIFANVLWSRLASGSDNTVLYQMKSISGAIDLYFMAKRRLPASLEDLTTPEEKTNQPYLKSIPRDPWGNPYEYRIVNATTHEYRISCSGEDQKFGTEDDIVFPEFDAPR